MKKISLYIFILFICTGILAPTMNAHASDAHPSEPCTYVNATDPIPINAPCDGSAAATSKGYHLLQPLPGLPDFNPDAVKDPHALGTYLNIIIKLFIGLCAVLAVVMIVIGGVEYMTSELISGKEAGKERIRGALFGLLLALAAWTILYQINPDLLNTDVGIGGSSLSVTLQDLKLIQEQIIRPGGPINAKNIKSRGTPCDADTIFNAAQSAGRPLTAAQASAMGCIGGAESGGCKNVAANVPGVKSTAYGPFQILAGNRARYGNTDACRSNPNSLECYSTMAAGLLRGRPQYQDWLTTQSPCPNAMCIKLNDSSVDLNTVKIKGGAHWPDMSSGVGAYCRNQGYPI